MYGKFQEHLQAELASIKEAGLYKNERNIASAQSAEITLQDGSKALNFCANNYLGLADSPRLIEAAKKAEIYEDILAMPAGFQTYVGERGTLLSGGQKQRIAIARIFLKNPPILILDEATSALDTITESKIQHAFDKLAQGRTTLIIAHRLSTIRSATRILVIGDGKIQEEGSHEDLMQRNGIYANLYNTQTQLHG